MKYAGAAFLAMVCGADVALAAPSCGKAAWYQLTSRTASGEPGNPKGLTAAHRTLPFGTRVLVTNLRNGRKVVVRINDRGPFTKGRVIDLTRAAANQLGYIRNGWAPVALALADRANAPVPGCPSS